jgi:hypothetical protein
VAALVVGGALAIDRVEQDVARGPERDLLHGLGEVPAWTSLWPLRAARVGSFTPIGNIKGRWNGQG